MIGRQQGDDLSALGANWTRRDGHHTQLVIPVYQGSGVQRQRPLRLTLEHPQPVDE